VEQSVILFRRGIRVGKKVTSRMGGCGWESIPFGEKVTRGTGNGGETIPFSEKVTRAGRELA
jgi:hypothetical protein